jgi:hypothetical protein
VENASHVKPIVFLNKASGSVVNDDDHRRSLAALGAPIIEFGSDTNLSDQIGNALLGDYLQSENVIYRQVKRFTLNPEHRMRFSLDGEILDESPLLFEVVPDAIKMFVGSEFRMNALADDSGRPAARGVLQGQTVSPPR